MIIYNKYWIIFKTNYVIINMTKCSIQFTKAQINRSSTYLLKSGKYPHTFYKVLWFVDVKTTEEHTVWLKKKTFDTNFHLQMTV